MATKSNRGISRQEIVDDGLDWLIETSFLAHLSEEDQELALASMEWRDFKLGDVLIPVNSPGRGVLLIVFGQVLVSVRDENGALDPLTSQGPGNLLGERSAYLRELTAAEVRADSHVRTLYMSASCFKDLVRKSRRFEEYIKELIDLRTKWPELLDTMLRNRFLRFLGRDDLERVLQSAELVRRAANQSIVRAGDNRKDVYIVVKGRVGIYEPGQTGRPREQLGTKGPGELVGHAAVLLDRPRSADVDAIEETELLRISDAAFLEIVTKNPPVRRHLMRYLANLDLSSVSEIRRRINPPVTFIGGAARGVGTTTVAYGTAAALGQTTEVTLVDLSGDETAHSLNAEPRQTTTLGIPTLILDIKQQNNLRVIWPRNPEEAVDLISALRGDATDMSEHSQLLVTGAMREPMTTRVLQSAENAVLVRWANESRHELSTTREQAIFQAARLTPDAVLPIGTNRKTVRFPEDASAAARFWRTGDISSISGLGSAMGRACARLARLIRGCSVGVALGGGGALGFAHISLLDALHAEDIPVDYVSGASFGALAGAVYVGGGLNALEELIRKRRSLMAWVAASTLSSDILVKFVDRVVGKQALGSTEVPYYPVGLDVTTGREFVLARGTLGEGVRSSSCLPGVFPAHRIGFRRLVDGGVINNVPASVVWEAGADFIIASNIIPENPLQTARTVANTQKKNLFSKSVARADDIVRSLFMLMSQTGRDRALLADYVFNFQVEGYNITDFPRGDEIAAAGRRQLEQLIPHIKYAYENIGTKSRL